MRRTIGAVLKTSDGVLVSPTNTVPVTTIKTQAPLGNATKTIVNATSTNLSDAPAGATIAVIVIEDGDMRFWLNSVEPTPATRLGLLLKNGQSLTLESAAEISGFRGKAETVDVHANIQYFGGA